MANNYMAYRSEWYVQSYYVVSRRISLDFRNLNNSLLSQILNFISQIPIMVYFKFFSRILSRSILFSKCQQYNSEIYKYN